MCVCRCLWVCVCKCLCVCVFWCGHGNGLLAGIPYQRFGIPKAGAKPTILYFVPCHLLRRLVYNLIFKKHGRLVLAAVIGRGLSGGCVSVLLRFQFFPGLILPLLACFFVVSWARLKNQQGMRCSAVQPSKNQRNLVRRTLTINGLCNDATFDV